jgi:nucleotide-binding universal stress UspA family protein
MKDFPTILFATDFSEISEHAFDYALSMAKKFDSRLIIMHIINEPVDLRGFYVPHISFDSLEQEIAEAAGKMMERFCAGKLQGISSHETVIATGVPYEEILKKTEEEKVALVVMGTHGRAGIDHLLFGSTAERVVRRARCAVMTVRPPVK